MNSPAAVVPYQESWPADFLLVANAVRPFLAHLPHVLEHVGSTSVPGLAAKPIIDLDVVIPTADGVEAAIDALADAGFEHEGDLGVPGREAFSVLPGLPHHHLYLVVANNEAHSNHVLLRDYLRANPAQAKRYGALKHELSGLLDEQRELYGQRKGPIIAEMLAAARAGLPLRESCRGLLVDGDNRVLLAEHHITGGTVLVPPGGGIEPGESLQQALARELFEETGFLLGEEPVEVWQQTLLLPEMAADGHSGALNHFFFVRTTAFDPAPGVGADQPGHPSTEGILDLRWWTLEQIHDATRTGAALFSPRDLGALVQDLLAGEGNGAHPQPSWPLQAS